MQSKTSITQETGDIICVLTAEAKLHNIWRQMADSSQHSRTQWWGCASIEPKSIYKCNLTVTLHNAGELLNIQPASTQINKSNPVSILKSLMKTCGTACTELWSVSLLNCLVLFVGRHYIIYNLCGSLGADQFRHYTSLCIS